MAAQIINTKHSKNSKPLYFKVKFSNPIELNNQQSCYRGTMLNIFHLGIHVAQWFLHAGKT